MTAPRRDRITVKVTILNGQSLSSEVNLNGLEIVGVEMPAGWDAASITLAALVADGTTFGKVQNEAGTEFTVTSPAAGLYIALSNAVTGVVKGLGRVKVRSGTASVPVNQTAQRDFFLVCLT